MWHERGLRGDETFRRLSNYGLAARLLAPIGLPATIAGCAVHNGHAIYPRLPAYIPNMNFLHYDLQFGVNQSVFVTLDKQANVRLMDDLNFSLYQRGQRHTYFGGLATRSPVQLRPPHAGRWHLVVDLGGYGGTVNASVQVVG